MKFADFFHEKMYPIFRNRRSWTRERYILDRFVELWGPLELSKISTEMIDSWKMSRVGVVSYSTIDREFNALATVFRKAWEWKYIETNPCAMVHRFNKHNYRYRLLSVDEARNVLQAAHRKGIYTEWIVRTMHDTGCRPGELKNLTWRNVDIKHGVFKFKFTKTSRDRFVYLTPAVIALTASMPRSAPNVITFWPRKRLDYVCQAIDNFRLYDLRKNFITRALQQGFTLRAVSEYVGATPETILRFYQAVSEEELRLIPARVCGYENAGFQLSLVP